MVYFAFTQRKKDIPAERYHSVSHEAGMKLLSYALNKEYGIELDSLKIEKGAHGKPFFSDRDDIFFNISHTDGMVVCAVSDNESGIDCELVRQRSHKAAERIFTVDELKKLRSDMNRDESFFRTWTMNEAYAKALGTGLRTVTENTVRLEGYECKFFTAVNSTDRYMICLCAKKTDGMELFEVKH